MSGPVRVVHVCDKFGVAGSSIHGVSRLFSWWFPRFDPSRFEVSLVGLKGPEAATVRLAEQGIAVHHLGRGRFDPRILLDLCALVRRRRAEILHVHGYAAADFGRLAAHLTGVPLVLHEHFADPAMPTYQGLADRVLARFTDAAIAVSRSTLDFLVRDRHVPASRVHLIWNGAPLDEFAPGPPEVAARVRRELDIPLDAPVVGVVGRLNTQKGHTFLLKAAPSIKARVPSVRFLVAGDGDLAVSLRAEAEALGVLSHVVFAGHRADVPAILGAIDVLAIPSLYEGTPLALFEAMAATKAIVATEVDGCKEILDHGLTALLVPPRDPAALSSAILRALEDPDLRRGLGSEAHRAAAGYDIRACVDAIQALYDKTLEARRKRDSR